MNDVPRDLLSNWDVLVVEDDPNSLEIAQFILKAYGATVYTAENGADALAQLKVCEPKFILCDLSMPVMDGWELIKILKKDRELSQIPVFALTAHAMIGDREKALLAGFHNYMTKPFSVKTFIGNLVVLLEGVPEFNLK